MARFAPALAPCPQRPATWAGVESNHGATRPAHDASSDDTCEMVIDRCLLHWRQRDDSLSRRDPRYSRDAFDRLRARYLARDWCLRSGRPPRPFVLAWVASHGARGRIGAALTAMGYGRGVEPGGRVVRARRRWRRWTGVRWPGTGAPPMPTGRPCGSVTGS